jgi:hypothetical protein
VLLILRVSDARSKDIKTASLGSHDIKPYKKLPTKNIIPEKSFDIVIDPIDPKRISKEPIKSLTKSSMVKAGLVFWGTIGVYYLAKTTNILSYFGWGAKNSKDLNRGEITSKKMGENDLTVRRDLETKIQANNPSMNHISQTYKGEDRTVKFKEIEIEKFEDLQEEDKNLLDGRSFNRRSISIENPIPNQHIIVGKSFNLTINGNDVFNSSSALSFLDAINIPNWLTSYCNPKLIGTCDVPGGHILLHDNYAYVSGRGSGLYIIDVSNPMNPILKGSYITSSAVGASVVDNYTYFLTYHDLHIIEISDPQNPTFKGSYEIPGNPDGIKIVDNYAYIVAWNSGLHVIEVSDPPNPIFKGSYVTDYGAHGIYVLGNYAYIINSHPASFHVVDISDPLHPTLKGSYRLSGGSIVALSGNYAYVEDIYPTRLRIIDVNDPTNPHPIGDEYGIHGFSGIAISGNYAYVTGGYEYGDLGLKIIDISDPSNLMLKGSYETPAKALGVAVSSDYVYVTDGDKGLHIIFPNFNELTLSGTPEFTGTYNIDISACNEAKEYIIDSFNVIVENNAPIVLNPIQDQTATAIPAEHFLEVN